jgi:GNAT superfamily N-acetyltransferase
LFTRTVRGFTVEPDICRRLQAAALACWRALGLAGYARVDMRMDAEGVAYVIDVNANPCLSEDAGFAAAAAQAGLDHAAVARRIAAADPAPASPARAARRPGAPFSLRHALRDDDDIGGLCAATGFFSADEIAIAGELASEHRQRGTASGYHFVLADAPDGLIGFACHGPTPGTAEAWDLYWVVVHPRAQGSGAGRALVNAVLAAVAAAGGRRLYAETASKPLYEPTRAFYAAAGFTLQAVVPDFYAPGDGKQIWLRLTNQLAKS